MAQQISSIFCCYLVLTCYKVLATPYFPPTTITPTTRPPEPSPTPTPVITPLSSVTVSTTTAPPIKATVNSTAGGDGSQATVKTTASGTAASVITSDTSLTPAAKVTCINGTTTDWSGTQNVSGSCQSSTCWVLATYVDDDVTEIKLSCASKVETSTCNKGECKYASGSCECCCSTDRCNNDNFEDKCAGARASSRGVRLSPPWLGLVILVLMMMKTL
ncbi:uncharacterized protein PB18E9.04c-like [Lingula anatina]|uniref:Uncharacterized protein PB18E9.04c-like n=1 Tax=Lingula anatina TaxID=7574 RepID=A0A1S3IGT3_LINAN|nr:uncharacterized protein PB18E9.04c-like [Lingula anatina]XP_013397427.1 uncharacterized protein PB18E9.04c-like [Lingula anatina]|eukprot:XP_013397426.1 uncharacterized protein PB18E9.04c-like [Lingula anatina]